MDEYKNGGLRRALVASVWTLGAAGLGAQSVIAQEGSAAAQTQPNKQETPAEKRESAAAATPPPAAKASASTDGASLEEVTVTGIRASLQSSLETKRDSLQVVDAISAEDVGQFPDKNLGEALQRVTGVQIQRDQGEGRSVSIRGAAPGLNRVEINGSSALSLTVGGGRDVDFRDLPVEFISRIEVVKSTTPEMTEGGLGGTVRVVTRRPFDSKEPYVAGSAQMVYSDLAKEYDPKVALIGSRTFFDDTFGALLAATYEKRHLNNNESRTTGWVLRTDARSNGVRAFVPDIPREVINRRETDRPAFNTILEWRPRENLNLYAEGTWTRGQEEVTSQFLQLNGSTGQIDAANTVVGPDNTVSHYEIVDLPTNRLSLTYRNILGDLERTQYTSAIGGTFDAENFSFDAKLTYANAKVTNNEKNANATITGMSRAIVDYNNSQHAPNFTFPGIDTTTSAGVTSLDAVFNPRTNTQDEVGGKFNVTYRPGIDWISALKTGVEVRKTTLDQVFFGETVTLNGIANPALLPQIRGIVDQFSGVNDVRFFETGDLGYGDGIRYWVDNRDAVFNAIGNPTPYDAPRLADTWAVEEKSKSAYVQAAFGLPDLRFPITTVIGVRYVDTDTTSSGFLQATPGATGIFNPATVTNGYNKWLPSLNVVAKLVPDKLQARFAAGKVIARPNPQDLALRQSLAADPVTGTRGNPTLQPYDAKQYDAGLEWYLSNQNYVSATYFRKEISTFVVNVSTTEHVPGLPPGVNTTFTQPVNGFDAVTINGIEAGGQYALDFLPRPFNGFGLLANVTYQKDKGYKDKDFFTGDALPFPGLSRTSANASVYYENQRFSVRASYNWRERYLITPQGRGNNPEFGENYGQLDANTSFNVTDNATLFLEVINLLDGVRIEDANSEYRRNIIETFGRRYFAGVRVKL